MGGFIAVAHALMTMHPGEKDLAQTRIAIFENENCQCAEAALLPRYVVARANLPQIMTGEWVKRMTDFLCNFQFESNIVASIVSNLPASGRLTLHTNHSRKNYLGFY